MKEIRVIYFLFLKHELEESEKNPVVAFQINRLKFSLTVRIFMKIIKYALRRPREQIQTQYKVIRQIVLKMDKIPSEYGEWLWNI
jgi:hypothetical protein